MAKRKPSALDALAKLDQERAALNERETALKHAAALELGTAVLAGGGVALHPDRLKKLVACIVAVGPEEALRRLLAAAPGDRIEAGKSREEPAPEVRHTAASGT